MKRFLFSVFSGITASWSLGQGAMESPPAQGLGAEDFARREEAVENLWARGEEALPELEAMRDSPDPEVAWRARRILRWIDLELTPETPPAVVAAVEAYRRADNGVERNRLYEFLLAQEAYLTLFRLPRHIPDPEVASHLSEQVDELAETVAKEKIRQGEDEEAFAILTDTRKSELGTLRWLTLAEALGKSEALWDELSEGDRLKLARWRGDKELIEKLAPDDHEVRLSLNLVNGELGDFLDKQMRRGDRRGALAKLISARWGGKVSAEEAQRLREELAADVEEQELNWKEAVGILSLTGAYEELRPHLETLFPRELALELESYERVEEAFALLGLEVGEPLPEDWITGQLGRVEGEFDILNDGCANLLDLAFILSERGREEDAERIFDALGSQMKEFSEEDFGEYLFYLTGRSRLRASQGAIEYALRQARAEEEELFTPTEFLNEAFYEDESVLRLNRFLQGVEPDKSDWEIVELVFALRGRPVSLPWEEVAEALRQLEESAAERESVEQWNLLSECAFACGELAVAERAARALASLDKKDEGYALELAYFQFLNGDYDESADLFLPTLREDMLATRLHAVVALELCGRSAEAAEQWSFLEKIALGDGSWLVEVATIFGRCGEYERQRELLERALLMLPAGEGRWFSTLIQLGEAARLAGHWQQAAVCGEAFVLLMSYDDESRYSANLHLRAEIDFAHAMAALTTGDRERGRALLSELRGYGGFYGLVANEIFLKLRQGGFHEEAEEFWRGLAPTYEESLRFFPEAANAHNTAAWVASRAACDLVKANEWIEIALSISPRSSAYLDTRAEVYFAMGEREKAIQWSEKACLRSDDLMELEQLRVQHRHFLADPFPLPEPASE
ncbi:tetratricopeptide repeat protein [Roseibacillus ishigakijimensis]|uniref:Tetratricopeptide repeat protein n=1 Tax=Roseibacillus ishigakijimensis TaxID=454146 RepID=A0A934VLB6_9BACT|nr:hypothetical protein [Roseibacillus ishigakijimensis]MBK1832715.1 hypothetical protein [Roseibacillus ishigakijimensis]